MTKQNETTYITIDPGASGGIAVMYSLNGSVSAYKYPDTVSEMAQIMKDIVTSGHGDFFCVIEKVHSMPGQGVKSCFSFGKNYGSYLGVLCAYGIPFIEVTPQKWMKLIGGVPKGGDNKTKRKNYIKAYAQQLYPHLRVTLKTADALAMLSIVDKLKV